MKGISVKELKVHADGRGWLSEIFRPQDVNKSMKGQVTVTTAHPGIAKGNHYHKRKSEWYCVIKGAMRLVLKDMKTGEVEDIVLSEDKLSIVQISPNIAHGFRNIGKDMLYVLMYVDEPFEKDDPDTFAEIVVD